MKPKATLRPFLAIAASSLMALSSASAQTTYTWTQTATGDQDWTTPGNWDGNGVFVSDAINELRFFADNTAQLGAGAAGASQVVINVPTSLSMNTLTLNGKGPNSDLGSSITIGTSASTWTIGDSTTSTINLNSILGGGGANRDLRYTIGANLTLVGNASGITTFTGASTSGYGAIFSGNIGESVAGKGITKSGSSLLVFSGNNSYTGTTSVTGGVLRLSSANALAGGIGATGGTSALTINGGVVELGATNFSRGLGAGSSQFQITGGTSGFSAYGGPRVVTVNGDASEELVWGSTHFAPTTLVLNQAYGFNAAVAPYPNGSIELTNKIDLNGSTRTVQVGANKAVISGDIRTSSGTAGLTKTGAGTLVLTGNNTYNGNTTISAGALNIGSASSIGGSGSSNLVMSGGTLQITGTALTSLSDLDSTVTFSNTAKGFDIQNAANTFTVDQVLSGTGTGSTLTKSGVGTLVLNKNNTYAGATTVTGGGTLVLDYSDSIDGNGSKLSDTAGITLSGTALVLKGGSHTELVSSTTLGHQTGNSISRDGGTSKISLGALTAPGGNNMHTLAISEANIATTSTANANGILALGRVTVGSDFAANDGSGNIVAYSGYTPATTAGVGSATVVHQLTGGGTMAANLASYALRIVNDANSNVLDLNTRNINLTNNSTLLYAGGFDNNYTINGTTGAVSSASGNQPFVINTYAGTSLTINTRVTSNFTNIQKAGLGTLVLAGNTQFGDAGGPTVVQQGVLRLAHQNALGTIATGTVVQGGAALELSGDINFAAEPITINGVGISNGGALRNQAGTNSFSGAITIGASGARINADASTSLTLTGGIATTAIQDVTFGGAGNTIVSTAAISGSGGVIKDGAGTLALSANNTYTGATAITEGTLKLDANDVLPNGSAVSIGTATLDADTRSDLAGTLDVTGNAVINLGSGATLAFADSSAVDWTGGTLNITGTLGATSLKFGTSSSGLSSAQLAKISVNGSGLGTYTLDASGYLIPGGPDTTAPTLVSIVDDKSGGPVTVGTLVTYTVTFSEDIADGTVTSADFSNAGSSSITYGTITETSPGVFTVQITPTSTGSLILQIPTTASITDNAAIPNALDNDPALVDDTTITVNPSDPYLAWAGPGVLFDADANGDGVDNGLAFLLGASGPNVSALDKLPVPTQSAGALVLTFQMLDDTANGNATLAIEYSNSLAVGSWTAVQVPYSGGTVDDIGFNITGTGPLNVTATIPVSKAAGGKLFGRVKAVNP